MALYRSGGLWFCSVCCTRWAWAAGDDVRYISDQLRINVREGPGLDYPVRTTLLTGARFTVVGGATGSESAGRTVKVATPAVHRR